MNVMASKKPQFTPPPYTEQCREEKRNVDDCATLACWRVAGHSGMHYDLADDIQWFSGPPEEAK